ncbi:MAG: hypothetical protein H7329_19515, partial [Opitutaceae bacterium]|nr:hypothetical protein [Cytophagales bacterium]
TYSHLFGAHEKTNLSDLKDLTKNRILNNNTILEDKYLHSSKDSVQIKTENNEVNIKTIKPKEQSLSQNRPETMDPTTQSNKTENVISVDTLQKPLQIKQTLTSTDSTKLKKKRILYITKQDTIIQFDTLHSPKQKRKRFK